MYPVTETYKESMDQQWQNESFVEMDLFNVDAYVQNRITATGSSGAEEYSAWYTTRIGTAHLPDIASLEQDYMKVDGSCMTIEPDPLWDYLLSTSLSSTTPNSSGEYPLAVPMSVTYNFSPDSETTYWRYGSRPITLYFGGSEASIEVEVTFGDVWDPAIATFFYTVQDGMITLTDLPDANYITMVVKVHTLHKPNQKARLRKILAGTLEIVDVTNIMEFSYRDINDCVGFELPQRTVSIALGNFDGRYDQETEYDNPTFHRFDTQAVFRVGYYLTPGGTVEIIPMGRFFMTDYSVNERQLRFSFTSALGVLNEFIHEWSNNWTTTLNSRFIEIMSIYEDIPDIDFNFPRVLTAMEKFGIRLDFGEARRLVANIRNPCPLIPAAQALQLLCNLTGNILRPMKSGIRDLQVLPLPVQPSGYPAGAPVDRILYSDAFFGALEWQAEDAINAIEVATVSFSSTTTEKELANGVTIGTYYPTGIESSSLISDAWVSSQAGGEGYATMYALFAYKAYLQAQDDGVFGAVVKGSLYESVSAKQTVVMSDKPGITLKTSNPLMNGAEGAGITVSEYANTLYGELKYNLIAAFSHRGYPELEAGDVVTLETKPGVFVPARILENTLTLNGGSVSGTTKARRLS